MLNLIEQFNTVKGDYRVNIPRNELLQGIGVNLHLKKTGGITVAELPGNINVYHNNINIMTWEIQTLIELNKALYGEVFINELTDDLYLYFIVPFQFINRNSLVFDQGEITFELPTESILECDLKVFSVKGFYPNQYKPVVRFDKLEFTSEEIEQYNDRYLHYMLLHRITGTGEVKVNITDDTNVKINANLSELSRQTKLTYKEYTGESAFTTNSALIGSSLLTDSMKRPQLRLQATSAQTFNVNLINLVFSSPAEQINSMKLRNYLDKIRRIKEKYTPAEPRPGINPINPPFRRTRPANLFNKDQR